jgi:UDP-glucose:(heptosyl)LPS alpha-1,3-glucosyltransferase
MKIALIVRNYDRRGGISKYTTELAEYMVKQHEVHVFTASWKDVRDNKIIFHKIPVLTFDFLKKRKKHALNIIFEVASFALCSYIALRNKKFDIVHVQGDYLGKIDIYTAHSCHKAWLDIFNKEKHGIVERLKKSAINPLHTMLLFIESHCIRSAKAVIAVSNGVGREVVKYYRIDGNKVSAIPNGVDCEQFSPPLRDAGRSEIRKLYKIKDDEFVIIFPAHEFKRKGLVQILEALKILANEKICVLVVGKDNPEYFVKRFSRIESRVIFAGEVQEIHRYYADSDAMVFPTDYEPFGLVLLEAMATGLPVITSKQAGAAELMSDGRNAILLNDSKNIDDIAEKIESIYRNHEYREKLGLEARKTAEMYSWDIIAEETMKIYEAVLEGRKE